MPAKRKRLRTYVAITSSMVIAGATAYFFEIPHSHPERKSTQPTCVPSLVNQRTLFQP